MSLNGRVNGSFNYSNSKWSLKYDDFAESLLNKGAQFDIRNNNNTTSFDLFIDAVIENQNSINSYSNTVNKESLGTYQINIKQREGLYSISDLFVHIGINEIRYKDSTPALHKLKELGLYQFSPIPHEEKNTIKNLIPKQVSRVRSSSQEDKFKKHPNKLIIYGVVGAVFVTIGVGLAVAALHKDLRILIVAAVACVLAGYCLYKAYQQHETVNSNLY